MKKRIALCLCVLLTVLSLCSCALPQLTAEEKIPTVLTVSGAEVPQDLFAYYLTVLLRDPQSYGIAADAKNTVYIDKAVELCVNYVAINSAFEAEKLHLSPAYKTQIADNVSTKWGFYKNYYNTVGIRKQMITKYETNEAKRKTLLEHKYGKDGTNPVSDIEWNAYYAVNYVTFQSVNGYLTKAGSDGSTERLSAQELAAAENRFKAMCEEVRGGKSLEDVCKNYANDLYVASPEVETITINRKTSNYPSDFFLSVQKMDVGTPRVIETADYIFLVVRQSDKSDTAYEAHRQACLQDMCAESFAADLKAITDGYKVDRDSSALKDVFSTVSKQFG